MIRDLVQATLDNALYPDVPSYWQRKSGADTDEYIVYTLSGDGGTDFADDADLTKTARVTIRYFYRAEKLENYQSRKQVESREEEIETALKVAGFTIPDGKFDVGDIDDIGYFVTVFECSYWRVV